MSATSSRGESFVRGGGRKDKNWKWRSIRASERGIWNEILNEDGDTMGKSFVGKRKRYIYLSHDDGEANLRGRRSKELGIDRACRNSKCCCCYKNHPCAIYMYVYCKIFMNPRSRRAGGR